MKRFCLLACLLSLAACGETTVKETLGLDNRAPDEYRVVSRPPLSVPPQFDLRPPGVDTGTASLNARNSAQAALLGDGSLSADTAAKPVAISPAAKAAGTTAAESSFLQKAGAADADPEIKRKLAEKSMNKQLERENEGFWSKVSVLPENKDPVVDAEKEAARIEKNEEQGKAVTEGETPTTGGGPISMFKRWFGDE